MKISHKKAYELQVLMRGISPQDTVALRHSVLWPNKPISYVLLPEDDSGHHFGAFLQSQDHSFPVAVISLFKEDIPDVQVDPTRLQAASDTKLSAARFRKFACDPSQQGRGVGTALLRHTFDIARSELGCSVIWCDARLESAGWYERRGMCRFGPLFWKGDVQYVRMQIGL